MIPIIRMSNDIARFLGAVPASLRELVPPTHIHVKTLEGDKMAWPALILWM